MGYMENSYSNSNNGGSVNSQDSLWQMKMASAASNANSITNDHAPRITDQVNHYGTVILIFSYNISSFVIFILTSRNRRTFFCGAYRLRQACHRWSYLSRIREPETVFHYYFNLYEKTQRFLKQITRFIFANKFFLYADH